MYEMREQHFWNRYQNANIYLSFLSARSHSPDNCQIIARRLYTVYFGLNSEREIEYTRSVVIWPSSKFRRPLACWTVGRDPIVGVSMIIHRD